MIPLLAALLLAAPALAGTLDQPWETARSEHFRLHYPVEAAPWALDIAAQLESIRARVSQEIGYEPPQVVDIVVQDPRTQPNGFALPWLRGPRMGVFASPPASDSVLGNYRSWEEDLIVHEEAHLVHMLLPSRNPWIRLFVGGTLGTGPITTKSPRWITEGYATVVEGRITGLGRPNSDGRALMLRQLAREGRMPTFADLDGSDTWASGGYAYLVGSAFLEWLELRQGDGALRDLWVALSARESRDLDQAFVAVFGDHPDTLYARFVAEITRAALAVEAARPVQEDTLWQDLERSTGAPALSPDGERIAVVLRPELGPSELVVWSTAENTEGESDWQEAVDEALEKDPEDITPLKPPVFPREPESKRVRPDRAPSEPRWTPDGDLLFTSWMRSGDGRMVPDLVRWTPGGGERRVTRGASVRDADPHPDGARAIAIRQAWSASQLVWVDLETGEWTAITAPDIDAVLDHPRLSPDGQTLAYLRNRGGWSLVVRDLETGAERTVALPAGASPSQPAWAPDGAGLYASLALDGFVEVWYLPLDGPPRQVTATQGGAMAPAPGADQLYFLSMDADGLDLHRLALGTPVPEAGPLVAGAPVLPPPPPPPIGPPERAEVHAGRYRFGGPGLSPILGLALSRSQVRTELGLRLGDVAGRTTLHALTSLQDGAVSAAGALVLRSLPLVLDLRGFAIDELDRRGGGELSLGRDLTWASGAAGIWGGGWLDAPLPGDSSPGRQAGFGRAWLGQRFWIDQAWLGLRADASGQLGVTGDSPWTRVNAGGAAELGWWPVGLEARTQLDYTTASDPLDQLILGGLRSSLYPEAWGSNWIFFPVLADDSRYTDQHAAAALALTTPWFVELEARRDWIGPTRYLANTLALQLDAPAPAQPIVKLSSARVQAGVACTDAVSRGSGRKACLDLDSYRYWLGITWRP